MVVDSEGNEVRRLVSDRRLAGRREAPLDVGRPLATTAAVVPDGTYRMRVVRRDESRVIDSVKEIDVDTVPPKAALDVGEAVRDRDRPSRRDAERHAALPRPREPGARDPGVPDRRRQAAHREALPRQARPDGHLGRPGERGRRSAPSPRPRGTTRSPWPCATGPATSPRRRCPRPPRASRGQARA